MANSSYEQQLTDLYDSLGDINSLMNKLALKSEINTSQDALTTLLNTILGTLNTLQYEVNGLKLTMADLLTELRSL